MTMVRELIRPTAEVGAAAAAELDLLEPDFDDLDNAEHADWVDAAPFRAHVRQLIESHGLTWRTVAVLAEVPAPALAGLIRGRCTAVRAGRRRGGPRSEIRRQSRPVPRLHPLIAERLFHLTSEAITAAARRPAHAGLTRSLLVALTERGWPLAEISDRTGLPAAELQAVATGRRADCSQLTEATVKAAAQALWSMTPPVSARPAPRALLADAA
ncbi:hypothetical protein [Microlunatus soli]|uniref:Uncharacterized protein n=1 Tax=Microlunatus soli TaxID=630515 RepID=A0A1H1PMK5_9ACTN|nr:hypothetical protein [Microlunatus soli]SDS12373.1 hypothetical protein SAMN04489812_0953 [Microlunatus soli]